MKKDTSYSFQSKGGMEVTFEELHIRHINLLIDIKNKELNNWFLKMAIINTFDDLKIFLNNLKKIRAIAIFKIEIGISPPQAYLLLHCGISSLKSLSQSTPYELERKIGRLERTLRVKTETYTTFIILKEWIKKASQIDKSIGNLG